MAWGMIGGAVATAVVGNVLAPSPSAGAPSGTGANANAAGAADPFAGQRGQYQTQLNAMMAPGAVFNSSDPSYAFRFNQGLESLNRTQNATGNMGSGAQMAAVTQFGQQQASQEYGNQFSRLSQLAGANVGSPAAAGQIMQGVQNQQQAGATAFGSTVGNAVGSWAGNAWNNWMNPAPTANPNNAPIVDTGNSSMMSGGGGSSIPWAA